MATTTRPRLSALCLRCLPALLAATPALAQQHALEPVAFGDTSVRLAGVARGRDPVIASWFADTALAPSAPAATRRLATVQEGGTGSPVRFRVAFRFAGGRFDHETEGAPTIDDDTSAALGRFSFEVLGRWFGGGIRLEGLRSDDDLFETTAGSPTEATVGEIFVHGTAPFQAGDNELPLRFGVLLRNYSLEDNASGDSIDWATVGFRAEFEPDFQLLQNRVVRWSLGGTVGFAVGLSEVSTDPSTFDADTTMAEFDLGVHTRLRISKAELQFGWMGRATRYDESDDVGGLVYRQIDTSFSGIYISFGAFF